MKGVLGGLLIAMANNADNVGVRIAYSMNGIKMSAAKNLWISVITFFISGASAFLGQRLSFAIGPLVCSVSSMGLLCAMGLFFIISPYIPKSRKKKGGKLSRILADPEDSDVDNSKDIDFAEATFLGISLSLNNTGGSFSGGMMGINAFLIATLSAAISFLTLFAGNYLTGFFERYGLGKKANIIAGLLLIAIGIKQLI